MRLYRIVDTGLTLEYIVNLMKSYGSASVWGCTLLDKKERRIKTDVPIDYSCCIVKHGFLVGYGLADF